MFRFRTFFIRGFCTSATTGSLIQDFIRGMIVACYPQPQFLCLFQFDPLVAHLLELDLPFLGYGFTPSRQQALIFYRVQGFWRRLG